MKLWNYFNGFDLCSLVLVDPSAERVDDPAADWFAERVERVVVRVVERSAT